MGQNPTRSQNPRYELAPAMLLYLLKCWLKASCKAIRLIFIDEWQKKQNKKKTYSDQSLNTPVLSVITFSLFGYLAITNRRTLHFGINNEIASFVNCFGLNMKCAGTNNRGPYLSSMWITYNTALIGPAPAYQSNSLPDAACWSWMFFKWVKQYGILIQMMPFSSLCEC